MSAKPDLTPIRRWERYGDLDLACIQVLNELVVRSGAHLVGVHYVRTGQGEIEGDHSRGQSENRAVC